MHRILYLAISTIYSALNSSAKRKDGWQSISSQRIVQHKNCDILDLKLPILWKVHKFAVILFKINPTQWNKKCIITYILYLFHTLFIQLKKKKKLLSCLVFYAACFKCDEIAFWMILDLLVTYLKMSPVTFFHQCCI